MDFFTLRLLLVSSFFSFSILNRLLDYFVEINAKVTIIKNFCIRVLEILIMFDYWGKFYCVTILLSAIKIRMIFFYVELDWLLTFV